MSGKASTLLLGVAIGIGATLLWQWAFRTTTPPSGETPLVRTEDGRERQHAGQDVAQGAAAQQQRFDGSLMPGSAAQSDHERTAWLLKVNFPRFGGHLS